MREEPISIGEFESWTGQLESADYRFLVGPLRNRFETALTETGAIRVTAQQYVGTVGLPSGRQLTVRPKVPVGSVFQMMSDTLQVPPDVFEDLIQCQDFADALELVAGWFADLVEQQIERGLFRSYIEFNDRISSVRGRIVLERQLRANAAMQHRLHCRFSELTWDIPENQIVRQVVRDLIGFGFSQPTKSRLRRLDLDLAEVTPTRLEADTVGRFTYSRLNQSYQLIHVLCRLFLTGFSLTEEAGATDFPGFLVDMNLLFEGYVTSALQRRLGISVVRAQAPLRLSSNQPIYGYPDLKLVADDKVVSIGDCKYKRSSAGSFLNADLYQVISYSVAGGVGEGFLIYPRHELPIEDVVAVVNSPISIQMLGIDLSEPGKAIQLECDRIANAVDPQRPFLIRVERAS